MTSSIEEPAPHPVTKVKLQTPSELGYQHTLMYGRYTSTLSEYAKKESKRVKLLEKRRRRDEKLLKKQIRDQQKNRYMKALSKGVSYFWQKTFAKTGEDWIFLSILGLLMAIISYLMDWGISICNRARIWLYTDLNYSVGLQYFAWIILPIVLILFAAGLVHLIAPQAIGSGIPEMKTILRGVTLKEYLTFKTLTVKIIGLTCSLGSGMPLGKEGPFVHIASMVATQLTKLQHFQGIFENESRSNEMLAAAAAVGVACCFAAPIGGVLFSIEVTTVYFAVRNYWRGFFAAAFGAMFFRLFAVWFQGHDTIKPVFKTYFESEFPYDPQELIIFFIIGVVCGLLGALFILMHRKYVLWMRGNKRLNSFLQKNRFIYPLFITWFIASVNFPGNYGFGQFIAGHLTTHDQVVTLFSNFSWTKDNFTVEEVSIMKHWQNDHTGIFVNLALFVLFTFVLSIVASTLPVPSGNFVPVFKLGAALGRFVGEAMHLWFPYGIKFSGDQWPIVPGGYSVVGAAAFSGAVTRTISICVIVSEMTGQITHIIPVMISVLTANAVAGLLQPSLFDSISMIKKLPYLPDLTPSSSGAYDVTVKDFMIREVKYIWYGMNYHELKKVIRDNKGINAFPIVNHDSMILLGSIPRPNLIKTIEKQIGRERRIQIVSRRNREMIESQMLNELSQRRPSRFEVVPVIPPIILTKTKSETSLEDDSDKAQDTSPTPAGSGSLLSPQATYHGHSQNGARPKKSILKKTNSFSLYNFGQLPSPFQNHYSTVTGAESRVRSAFHTIFKKSELLQDASPGESQNANNQSPVNSDDKTPLYTNGLSPPAQILPPRPSSPSKMKKVQLPRERVIDMSPDEQKAWENEELSKDVDFSNCQIDAAPFQLVAKTTLLKVHSIFSLLGINHSYVTATGKLIGVVGMKELRKVIEDCNSGSFHPHSDSTTTEQESSDRDLEINSPTETELTIDSQNTDYTPLELPDEQTETERETTDDESQRLN